MARSHKAKMLNAGLTPRLAGTTVPYGTVVPANLGVNPALSILALCERAIDQIPRAANQPE